MAYSGRSIPSQVRAPSMAPGGSQQSSALAARIEEKRAELAHLQDLRDLSGEVASQMEQLEQKLSTLSDGTEAIATVVGNWHNVLRAINMASSKLAPEAEGNQPESDVPLPQTLVRIPTEHAPALQAQTENLEAAEGEDETMGTAS
ncbi:hypothetical protein VHEMI01772 [[Torrubiella] hemipterigena]|uniref:DASH complex subunit DAD2 n=1 Tax=[Torrubiella] hemipterigena TaxID=1531966 RepID=A0A0A1SMV9_9HYPO|nr:hypothetical protein VHEMI01772 [[Torrubiella] hemipterigena]